MFCTSCGVRLLDQDRFCADCGKPVAIPAASYQTPPRPLERDMYRSKIGGVCAGLANYLAMDVTMVRLAFVLGVLLCGLPIILYFVAWIVMPRNDERDSVRVTSTY
jgi:phage shock protein PspC (stress-responsive transcriptional regulator)